MKKQTEEWFKDRVGKYIMANSNSYNGAMKITDEKHALYLCQVSQHQFGYCFSELEKQPYADSELKQRN